MKQTAVEFLIEEMQKRIPPFYAHYVMNMDEVYEQAKEMEKQQIEHSYLTCWEDYVNEGKHWEMGMNPKETFTDYYNETYGKQ